MIETTKSFCFLIGCLALSGILHAADDIVVTDFEQEGYGEWAVTGEAFGPGPATETLPGQMHVGGYKGKRLINSFFKGDKSTGTLTSPPIVIERDYLHFLIGGGAHAGKTCINLLHNGEVVRTATGSADNPGDSENLNPHAWNVEDLKGKTASLQIVDQATGGWGHINIDHIVLSDQKPRIPDYRPQERTFTVNKKFLVIPIKNGAKGTLLTLDVEGVPVRHYGVELATNPDAVDWYAFFTIESYKGSSAKVKAARSTEEAFALIRQADEVPGAEKWYTESLRPQFHFSQAVGWNNDPNGMVYLDGEWHLYFQHNPVGWKWGNMTWGHAVSRDLVHWEQLPNALFPKTMAVRDCFSGGATVDPRNTAGWKKGEQDVLVAFLTDTGAGESVAYSTDRGRTFTWYEGNPVVRHSGRDPKVIWYTYDRQDKPINEEARKLGGHWVMVVFDQNKKDGRNAAFYTSTNLKEWEEQSHLPGYYECTELFELPVDPSSSDGSAVTGGNRNKTRWVVFAADARYAIGDFDGRTFTPEHKDKHQMHWGKYYASQTFDNAPDGRRIQMGWIRIASPGMPFNQTFSFPHELTLRTTTEGIRMFAKPVTEIEKLHRKKHTLEGTALKSGSPTRVKVSGELFDIRATFALGKAQQVGLDIGGNRIIYDVPASRLGEAPMKPDAGKVQVQVLVDRTTIETCGNDGRVFITSERRQKGEVDFIEAFAQGDGAKLLGLEISELESIWNK